MSGEDFAKALKAEFQRRAAIPGSDEERQAKANAAVAQAEERAVVCVNALAGVPDPDEFVACYLEMLAFADDGASGHATPDGKTCPCGRCKMVARAQKAVGR